ncbi:MAG TPA: CocE/NonD family hydrolase [Chitinophagales bacterium]|nr:CocE/NonD family hydrolase [Chitinophagales bacterium]
MKKFSPFLLLAIAFFVSVTTHAEKHKKAVVNATQISRPGEYVGFTEPQYKGYKYHSYYVPMRDSVKLAVDVFLPKKLKAGDKVPTILYLTRYVRSVQAKFPFNLFMDPVLTVVHPSEVELFTSHGYACVVVDVRGTGASQGDRRMEFSPEEVADGKDIVDWIVAQPWSAGKVGTTGVSYLGTTAEMLLVNQHPAVKACIPRSNIYDLYNYVVFPGGVCQGPFVEVWGHTTNCLDNNNFKAFGGRAKLAKGIHPVHKDKGSKMLKECVANHKNNFDVFKGLQDIKYRDDVQPKANGAADEFSIYNYNTKIENSGTAIYRIGGWYDGALAKSCVEGFMNTKNTVKVLVGPWDHGPQSNVSPYAATKTVNLDVELEMLRFFDYYLKGIENGINNEPAITYYTVGEESWNTSNTWPAKSTRDVKLFLSADNKLSASADAAKAGKVNYKIDYTATTGGTSRWNSVTTLYMHGPTNYSNRVEEDKKLLTFTAAPLNEPAELTGHPIVKLQLAADASDATVFCYLEDVAPDGTVTYVTEGLLRPLHRKVKDDALYKTPYPDHTYEKKDALPVNAGEIMELDFDMLPISYQFKKGHSIRVSIAGADEGHFNLPSPKPENFTVQCGAAYVQLPVMVK